MRRVLATGGNGQVGTELKRFAWPPGWELTAIDIDELDLRNRAEVASFIADGGWSAVINAAAYTAVDRAESDAVAAWETNALAPAALAQACANADSPLIHISTDYVFDGARDGRWREGDPVGPLNVYGASKLGGELAVRTGWARHAIVRTSWVVSAHGSNFVKTMLRLAAKKEVVGVVADQRGAPTSARDLAAVLARIAMGMAEEPGAPTGTFHFSNAGETTWHGVAAAAFGALAARGSRCAALEPIDTASYPTPARRPVNSLLDHRAIGEAFGIVPRPWEDAISDILDELMEQAA